MLLLLIIADDFTGALDTGVQFAAYGAATRVMVKDQVDFASCDAQVLVVDTETRHLPPEKAYQIVEELTRAACRAGIRYIYKKTDSALRGNIGAELAAVLQASNNRQLPFLPAFPKLNRVTRNGVHYVDGGLFHNFPVSIIREECERIIGVNVSPLIPQKYKQTIFHIAERSYHYMFRANTLEDREMCDVLIEAEEFGLYKTFDLENVDVICNIGYSAAARCFEKVLDENKYETLVKAIAARKKGLMP